MVVICLLQIFIPLCQCQAGEKEEFQWKTKYLIENIKYIRAKIGEQNLEDLQKAQQTLQEWVKELDAKGFMLQPDGTPIEKPKPNLPGGEKK